MPKLASGHYFLDLDTRRARLSQLSIITVRDPIPTKPAAPITGFRKLPSKPRPASNSGAIFAPAGSAATCSSVSAPADSDDYATAESLYSETAPGILAPSHFFQDGGFLQFDYRDTPGDPHSGGNYSAQYSTFNDVDRGHYSFDRLDLEAQQYIPFFNKFRVIALRAKIIATSPHQGNEVPFYLQPTLGGPDDLRGYRAFRFYDNNMAVLNGEYRWQVFTGLDMALFVDGGQVFDRWEQINYRSLKADAGFGFRFKMNNAVFMRIDTGFSPEGFGCMVQIRQHFLIFLMLTAPLPLAAQKFYPDDPLRAEPPPLNVAHVKALDIDAYYDFFRSTFFEPDKEEIKHHDPSPSEAVNTLGEVPDNSWFTNRIGSRPMSVEELVRGPGVDDPPTTGKPWTVISAKNEGVMSRPCDSRCRRPQVLPQVRSQGQSRDGLRGRRHRREVLLRPRLFHSAKLHRHFHARTGCARRQVHV